MYIPPGFGTVFPYIFASRAAAYLDFLRDAFGAEILGKTEGPDGSFANARVKIGSTCFMMSEASAEFTPTRSAFYIFVDDVDSGFRTAVTTGAEAIVEPMDMPYDDRQGGVTDSWGNIWWISKRLVEKPYDT